ncbi:hypothetical protein QJS04_geneDACA020238 [Acorus gramineus]|uniref:Reverse transcriptase domain-containing protein n=1 Tax=Acorus gramineus TaxID=55184 RepID=A0AAV9A456_ACOGR|nr:hypothetical protein QJS04_geneDACA020238 [Acorus gramineus]
MNFSSTWIQWIMACIQSPRFSVLINGSPFRFFESSSGLRQGDLVSPLLFVLGMKMFSQQLDVELTHGKIGAFTKHSIAINHLLFADDLIIFSPITQKSRRALRKLLSDFAILSGLELNSGKSSIFCGGQKDLHQHFSSKLGIPRGSLSVTYLGLLLFTRALNAILCLPLVNKLCKRLQC